MSIFTLQLVVLACLATLPQDPLTYEANRTSRPPVVDGLLGEEAWSEAPWTEDFVDILGPQGQPPTYRTRAKLLWDERYLYVGALLEEPHLWATLEDHDAIVYQDDDFEIFLDPGGRGVSYFEFEINALGTVLDLYLDRPYREGGRADLGWNAVGLRAEVAMAGTLNDPSDRDSGWSVELAIPWRDLVPPPTEARDVASYDLPPNPGDVWRVNFSRVDWPLVVEDGGYRRAADPTRDNPHPESNWVWSPQGAINMHIPGMWGVVRFVVGPQNSP